MTYDELPTTTSTNQPQPNMACPNEDCPSVGILYSAERGDYFMADPNAVVRCARCRTPMRLCKVHTELEWL